MTDRDTDVIEPETSVVDAVHTHLVTTVSDPDARKRNSRRVSQRDKESMDSVMVSI